MSAIQSTYLKCDRCRRTFGKETAKKGFTFGTLRKDARESGWRHYGLKGATNEDICDRCARKCFKLSEDYGHKTRVDFIKNNLELKDGELVQILMTHGFYKCTPFKPDVERFVANIRKERAIMRPKRLSNTGVFTLTLLLCALVAGTVTIYAVIYWGIKP